jgi:hypothetical protein
MYVFFLVDATDAPQPGRLIVQRCDEDEVFSAFPF